MRSYATRAGPFTLSPSQGYEQQRPQRLLARKDLSRHVWARPGIISVPITRRLDAWVLKRRAVFRSSRDGTIALEHLLAHQEPAPALLALMLERWAVAFFTTHMEAFGSGVENIVPLPFFSIFSFFSVSVCFFNVDALLLLQQSVQEQQSVCAGGCGRETVQRTV